LLGLDLLISALLVGYTGLEHSPYYLYSLAPILAAAFFFRIRGGLLAAAGYSLFYLAALWLIPPSLASPFSLPEMIGELISFFLIGAIFGYPSLLVQRLRQAHADLAVKNEELSTRNRDLHLLQELSLVMQSSADPAELQEAIARGLVQEMGYRRAIIGLYDSERDLLTSWIASEDSSRSNGLKAQLAHTTLIPLNQDQGPLSRALKGKLALEITDGEAPTTTSTGNSQLTTEAHYLVLPLSLRGQPLGVILVDDLPPRQRLSAAERLSLDHLATHAGVALGTVQLCIDRAQRLAVIEERQRIAADLHDNVSQVLYGLGYSLEAAIQLLAHEPQLQQVLAQLHTTVTEAQGRVRKTIFETKPDEITAEAFVGGLHYTLRTISPAAVSPSPAKSPEPGRLSPHQGETLDLRIDLPGDFDQWAELIRRQLYRVAQEALANTLKHAHARQMIVKLSRNEQQIELRLSDDGDGFDLAKINPSQHLGLQTMAGRIESLGGSFEIDSAFGEGTLLIATVPYVPASTEPTCAPALVVET
jgi:signal transduction histidine kinase